MKIAVIVSIAAVAFIDFGLCSPEPLLFGVSLTDAAGNIVGATNPVQTAALLGAGTLAVAGGAALGGLLTPRPTPTTTTTVVRRPTAGRFRRRRRRFRNRGKRNALPAMTVQQEVDMLEEIFKSLIKADPEDCYRRLFCDIAATNNKYEYGTEPMIYLLKKGPKEFEEALTPMIKKVRYEFSIGVKVGDHTKDAEFCEKVFACPFTGPELDDLVIGEIEKTKGENDVGFV